ncbi:hypothetical protein ACF0H5_011548 [Mactra antiquata]
MKTNRLGSTSLDVYTQNSKNMAGNVVKDLAQTSKFGELVSMVLNVHKNAEVQYLGVQDGVSGLFHIGSRCTLMTLTEYSLHTSNCSTLGPQWK